LDHTRPRLWSSPFKESHRFSAALLQEKPLHPQYRPAHVHSSQAAPRVSTAHQRKTPPPSPHLLVLRAVQSFFERHPFFNLLRRLPSALPQAQKGFLSIFQKPEKIMPAPSAALARLCPASPRPPAPAPSANIPRSIFWLRVTSLTPIPSFALPFPLFYSGVSFFFS
jgi:hypothetical protein